MDKYYDFHSPIEDTIFDKLSETYVAHALATTRSLAAAAIQLNVKRNVLEFYLRCSTIKHEKGQKWSEAARNWLSASPRVQLELDLLPANAPLRTWEK